jgi:hypothetical protein
MDISVLSTQLQDEPKERGGQGNRDRTSSTGSEGSYSSLMLTEEQEIELLREEEEENLPFPTWYVSSRKVLSQYVEEVIPKHEGMEDGELSDTIELSGVSAEEYNKMGKQTTIKLEEKIKVLEHELVKAGRLILRLQEKCETLQADKKYLKVKVKTLKTRERRKKLKLRMLNNSK